ncbi:MAG: T9SS type A sorting domain-containing protein, partial [Bacteroidia bacterium]|nr:T9SS type A sorting domain-containing protein [Bacteroidia bacterium]
KNLLLYIFLFTTVTSFGQLHPSIGIGALPNDNDSVCPIPLYTGSFDNSGYHNGDTVPDFTLYKPNGDSVNLATELQSGTPVLLVTGNYTCPVFRGKINDINTMASIYGSQLKIVVVYVVEAHPIIDVSPYSGTVWVPSANTTEGVLFRQPATYGQRKEIVDSLLAHYTINVPIVIDGPCNNWWLNYGPSPNNAYLINTNGVVVSKNAWFNRAPDNMYCSIDSLLGVNSGHCVINGNNGLFSFTLDTDSIFYGLPGETLSIHTTLTNLSAGENVVIDIIKKQISIPATWQTALCADICYAPTSDSIRITLAPSQVQPFIFYFYTDVNPDSGFVRVLFRNVTTTNNRFAQWFMGYTNSTIGIKDNVSDNSLITLFPNPAASEVNFTFPEKGIHYLTVTNVIGKVLLRNQTTEKQFAVDVKDYPAGIYFITMTDEKKSRTIKRFVKM